MALLRQGGGEGAAVGLPLVVGAAHGLLALEVRDNPAGAQDGGLARSDVVRTNLLAYLVGLAIGVAGGEGEVDEVHQLEVNAGGNIPGLGFGFLDRTGNGQRLIVVVGHGPGTGGAIEVGALDVNGLAGITRVGATLTDGGRVGRAEVALRQGVSGRSEDEAGSNGKSRGGRSNLGLEHGTFSLCRCGGV